MVFERNDGQTDPEVRFLAHGSDADFFLTKDSIVFGVKDGLAKSESFKLSFSHSTAPGNPVAELPTGGVANYFRGRDSSGWVAGAPMFSKLRYSSVYPGTDLTIYGTQGRLEYDFELGPNANPGSIELKFDGARELSLTRNKNLSFYVGDQQVSFLAPHAYQLIDGDRREVTAMYRLIANDRVAFQVGAYDPKYQLVIDPVVTYATAILAGNQTGLQGMAVDASGDVIVTGPTFATNYPVVSGKPASTSGTQQVYVTKLNPAGDTILYSTYLPAGAFSTAEGVTLGADGAAYVFGITSGSDFPVTSQNLGTCAQFCNAGFVTKLDPSGAVVYSTLLGSGQVLPRSVFVNAAGEAYITGNADNSLMVVNPYQGSTSGGAFFAKLNASGTGFEFSSYYGGTNTSGSLSGQGIALDSAGNIIVGGNTSGPVPSSGQIQSGIGDIFLAKFSPDGSHLLFGTSFGGDPTGVGTESLLGLAVGPDNTVYLVGTTDFSNFPYLLRGSRRPVGEFGAQTFATAFNPSLTSLKYSTLVAYGSPTAFSLDAKQNLYIAVSGGRDVFTPRNALEVDAAQTAEFFSIASDGAVALSSRYGGSSIGELPSAMATDSAGNLYLAGSSGFVGGPLSDAVIVGQTTYNLLTAAGATTPQGTFVTKIAPDNLPQLSLGYALPFLALRNAGSGDLHISSITPGGGLAKIFGNCGTTIKAASACVLTLGDRNGDVAPGTVTIVSDANPATQTFSPYLPNGSTGSIGDLLYLDTSQIGFLAQQIGTQGPSQAVKVWNVGTVAATINSIQVGSAFKETHDCGPSLAPGAFCTINLTWLAGQSSIYLSVNYDVASQLTAYLPGTYFTSATPLLVSIENLDFGTQLVGVPSLQHVVTFTNVSNGTVDAPTASVSGTTDFTIADSACTASLQPQQSCGMSIAFNPTIDATRAGVLNVAGDGTTANVNLNGVGKIASQVSVSPFELQFPYAILNVPRASTSPIVLTNNGATPVNVSGISFTSSALTETDTCSGALAPGSTCSVVVTFTPEVPGNINEQMTIAFDGTAVNQTLSITGSAYFPLTVMPTSLDFGSSTMVGQTSPAQNMELANGFQGKPQPYTLTVTGDFVVDSSKCPNPAMGNYACPLSVTFQPKSAGVQMGSINLSFPGISLTEQIPVKGSTPSPTPSQSPNITFNSSLDFGQVSLGGSSTQAVVVTNTSNQDIVLSSLALSGANVPDFTAATGQCATIAAGSNCSIAVVFRPSVNDARSAQLSLSDNASGSPQLVNLTGIGVAPVSWTAPASSSATVASGQSASYSLALSSEGSFTGKVVISCANVPSYAVCTPSPSSLTIASGQKATVTVSISTGTSTTANNQQETSRLKGIILAGLLSLPVFTRLRRQSLVTFMLFSLFITGVALIGCGGSNSSGSPSKPLTTPIGTYTFQVVATSGTQVQAQNLTLVVQ